MKIVKSGPFRVRLSAEKETSRERPKSAPYQNIGSKIAKGLQCLKYSLLQYPREEKIEQKSEFF